MIWRSAEQLLEGRTAVVSGAGSGLGREIALALGGQGARVVLVGRTAATLEAVAAELEESQGSARVEICDVSDPGAVQALGGRLADEEVSVLINNAGIGGPVADLVDIDPDGWDATFAANVRSVYLMCRQFLPAMVERRTGHVVNLASVTGKRPLSGRTPYAASKMAVIGLTATLAWEVGRHGVMVNSLSPGPVDGPRMRHNFAREAQRTGRTAAQAEQEYVSRGALGRLLEEPEVGRAVVAMLSMPGLTGADIDLSTGMVAR